MRVHSAALKQEIEAKLAARIPAALSPLAQQAPRLLSLGDPALNTLLGGGMPMGAISEVSGPAGSGRTSIAFSLLAQVSAESACAYIDVGGEFSPYSAAASGVRLSNLLWIRFCTEDEAVPQSVAPAAGGWTLPASAGRPKEPMQQGCGGPHPRLETRGLAPALEQVLSYKKDLRREKAEGTPGYPNQPIGLSLVTRNQVEWERFNSRTVDEADPIRLLDQQAAVSARDRAQRSVTATARQIRAEAPWTRLDRAIRATDQVLQSGGFRVVVLDLAFVQPEQALRIPSATWFRFRRAAQESDAILLLLTQAPCARSSAGCVLECSAGQAPKLCGLLSSTELTSSVARQRAAETMGKKAPGRATHWLASPAWMRAVGS